MGISTSQQGSRKADISRLLKGGLSKWDSVGRHLNLGLGALSSVDYRFDGFLDR